MALLLRLHENARVINNTNLSLKLKCAPHNDTEASAYIYYSSMICTTLVYITFASVYPYSLNSDTFIGILNYSTFLRSHPLHYKLSLYTLIALKYLNYITLQYTTSTPLQCIHGTATCILQYTLTTKTAAHALQSAAPTVCTHSSCSHCIVTH